MVKQKLDAVFEGGGVKGIGLAGALCGIDKYGRENNIKFVFQNVAGTSAGAIVAALVAAGYTSSEIKTIIRELDYNKFKDEGIVDKIPFIGKALSIGFEYGIYEGDFLEKWLNDLLEKKGVQTFGDLKTDFEDEKYAYKLQLIASDISDHRLLVLPQDLKDFGFNPDSFNVARAVRMSMSIPIYFEPVKVKDGSGREHLIVDGGLLSNFPLWLLDDGSENPKWPTFGFKLCKPNERKFNKAAMNPIKNLISLVKSMAGTMLDAHDSYHISESSGDLNRTILINTIVEINNREVPIGTIDFDISTKERDALFRNGEKAAYEFISSWNFDTWKDNYRRKKVPVGISS